LKRATRGASDGAIQTSLGRYGLLSLALAIAVGDVTTLNGYNEANKSALMKTSVSKIGDLKLQHA